VERLYGQLKPFYHEIHAFVRHKLSQFYGDDKVDPAGPIPAHLLGSLISRKITDPKEKVFSLEQFF
jgi:peptidyl-dipeptidase A